MNQTQNVSIGHGFVNNGTMTVYPVEVFQNEALPEAPPSHETNRLAAHRDSGEPPGSGIVRAINFIGWTLFIFFCVCIIVALVAVLR